MLFPILFFISGVLAGVVINRAADNLPPPAESGLLETPECPFCGTPRTPVQQSGILAFLLRRDKCPKCGAPLNLRAPLVEIAAGALFAFLAFRYPLGEYLFALAFFTAVLLLIAVIDLEHKLILNVVVLPAAILAVLLSPIILKGDDVSLAGLHIQSFFPSIVGSAVGYAITLAIYYFGVLFLKLVNRSRSKKINTVAFGMGDVKLAALLGALIGFPAIIYALIYAILFGGIGAFIAILIRLVRQRGYSAFMAIPYGPYLILAGWGFLIFGREILSWILAT